MIELLKTYISSSKYQYYVYFADDIEEFRNREVVFELLLNGKMEMNSVAVIYTKKENSSDDVISLRVYLYEEFGIFANYSLVDENWSYIRD